MAEEKKTPEKKAPAPKPGSTEPNQTDQVITPAGPVPREQVHEVKPGETVRRNKDGTYTVVPKPD